MLKDECRNSAGVLINTSQGTLQNLTIREARFDVFRDILQCIKKDRHSSEKWKGCQSDPYAPPDEILLLKTHHSTLGVTLHSYNVCVSIGELNNSLC